MKTNQLRQVVPTYGQAVDERQHYRVALYNAYAMHQHYQAKADACGLSLQAYCQRFNIKLPKLVKVDV